MKAMKGRRLSWRRSFRRFWMLYLLLIPGLVYYIVFKYVPMVGVAIAFEKYKPFSGWEGIFTSKWVGFANFAKFFRSKFSGQLIGNSLYISVLKLAFGFPAPIVLAVMINEVTSSLYKRTVQTVSYLPHFLSMVIVCSMVRTLTTTDGGLVNAVVTAFGGEPIFFLGSTKYFRPILVISSVWQSIGWNSIIYLAAMTNIDPQLYEAATMDGANWFQKIWHITIPSILPIASLMLIMRMGNILDAGFEQIYLLYSPAVYSVADTIDTYVYREGLVNMNYSYSTAVSVFKSVVSLVMVLGTNFVTKKMGQEGIW